MKKITHATFILAVVAVTMVFLAGIATAASTPSPKDLGKLNAEISMLNSDANLPQGDKIIAKQLMDTFKVSSDKVSSLIGATTLIGSNKQQYGDAAAILAFASEMPGGVTVENITKVSNMRQQTPDWGQLAQNLNVDIGKVASKLSSLENDTHKSIKQALADSFSSGSAAGGMSGGSESGAGSSKY
jgi:hypothetical protein